MPRIKRTNGSLIVTASTGDPEYIVLAKIDGEYKLFDILNSDSLTELRNKINKNLAAAAAKRTWTRINRSGL